MKRVTSLYSNEITNGETPSFSVYCPIFPTLAIPPDRLRMLSEFHSNHTDWRCQPEYFFVSLFFMSQIRRLFCSISERQIHS
jgi:hypothetical protein